ncbi:MAG: hypothetical protein N3B17_02920 [Chlorobi bacterium]|nr:hypothetical protein [Chlorobiota bacterium]
MTTVARCILAALLASSLALADTGRPNKARTDTLDGKIVIELYTKGKLDTVIVLDKQNTRKTPAPRLDTRTRTTDTTVERFERYRRQAERNALDAGRYARLAEQFARRAERLARELEKYDDMFSSAERLFPPAVPDIPPMPDIPDIDTLDGGQIERSLSFYWELLDKQLEQLESLTQRDTAAFEQNRRLTERLTEQMQRSLEAYRNSTEHLQRFSEQLRKMVDSLAPQLERLQQLLERQRRRLDR